MNNVVFLFRAVPTGPVVNPVIGVSSSTSLLLTWEPPVIEDQNGNITGYVINVTAVETGMNFQLTSTEPSLLADGLRPFTTYICRIAARTTVGIGPYSIAVTAVTNSDGTSASDSLNCDAHNSQATHSFLTESCASLKSCEKTGDN